MSLKLVVSLTRQKHNINCIHTEYNKRKNMVPVIDKLKQQMSWAGGL